jgi:hypothetical protein
MNRGGSQALNYLVENQTYSDRNVKKMNLAIMIAILIHQIIKTLHRKNLQAFEA